MTPAEAAPDSDSGASDNSLAPLASVSPAVGPGTDVVGLTPEELLNRPGNLSESLAATSGAGASESSTAASSANHLDVTTGTTTTATNTPIAVSSSSSTPSAASTHSLSQVSKSLFCVPAAYREPPYTTPDLCLRFRRQVCRASGTSQLARRVGVDSELESGAQARVADLSGASDSAGHQCPRDFVGRPVCWAQQLEMPATSTDQTVFPCNTARPWQPQPVDLQRILVTSPLTQGLNNQKGHLFTVLSVAAALNRTVLLPDMYVFSDGGVGPSE